MFRKFCLILVSFFLLLNFFQPKKLQANCPFDRSYVGLAIGVATNMAHHDIFTTVRFFSEAGGDADLISEETHPSVYQLRPWGEIYGGWGFCSYYCPWLYLGGRLGINFSSWDLKQSSKVVNSDITGGDLFLANLDVDIKTHLNIVEYTLDFKPGFVFCNTMLFMFVGGSLNRAHIKSRTEFTFDDFTTGLTTTALINKRNSKLSYGLRVGGGLETMVTSCMSLCATYSYTLYHRPDVSDFANVVTDAGTAVNGLEVKHSAKTRKQVVSLGINYYF